MSVRLRTTGLIVGLTLGLAVFTAGCGGGGGSDSSATTTPGAPSTTAPKGSGTLPPYTPPKHTFAKLDGSKARFVNLLLNQGKPVDMDVYWGADAATGKKATSVKYGEVTDWMPIQLDKNPDSKPSDGKKEVAVVFYQAGKTDLPSRIQQEQETLDGDVLYQFTMGTSDSTDPSFIPSSVGVGYQHNAGKPPAGKAWVAFNTTGVGGVKDGHFMTLSTSGKCNDLIADDTIDTANNGQAFVVDPGTLRFDASDANTDCAQRTDPVSIDLQAGDRYIIYAYGGTKDDRKLMAVKLGDD